MNDKDFAVRRFGRTDPHSNKKPLKDALCGAGGPPRRGPQPRSSVGAKVFRITLPVVPSIKNSRRLLKVRAGGKLRTISARSIASREAMSTVQLLVDAALADYGVPVGRSLFGDDRISVRIEHDVATGTVDLTVRSKGPKAPGSGRRDLQNLQDGLLDALEGLIYDNDRQVDVLVMRRRRALGVVRDSSHHRR